MYTKRGLDARTCGLDASYLFYSGNPCLENGYDELWCYRAK